MPVSENHISQRGKAQTAAKFKLKIAILQIWTRDGIPWKTAPSGEAICDADGHRYLEYFPADMESMAGWGRHPRVNTTGLMVTVVDDKTEASRNVELSSLVGMSPGTISEEWHKDLREQCQKAIRAIKIKARAQIQQENRGNIIAALKADNQSLRGLVGQQEHELKVIRAELASVKSDAASAQIKIKNNLDKAREEIARKDEKIAALNATLSKVVPFKAV